MKKTAEKATAAPIYVAVGPLCWGKGTTPKEAVKNAKEHCPRSFLGAATYEVWVYRIDGEFLGIRGHGEVEYNGTLARLEQHTEKLVIRKRGVAR